MQPPLPDKRGSRHRLRHVPSPGLLRTGIGTAATPRPTSASTERHVGFPTLHAAVMPLGTSVRHSFRAAPTPLVVALRHCELTPRSRRPRICPAPPVPSPLHRPRPTARVGRAVAARCRPRDSSRALRWRPAHLLQRGAVGPPVRSAARRSLPPCSSMASQRVARAAACESSACECETDGQWSVRLHRLRGCEGLRIREAHACEPRGGVPRRRLLSEP
jgi:hypothetical protein